ncbi:MAG: hypothetical protein HN352_18510 [Bacteroidetes bacterium]|nr:hypothetical protein [Bacteroidota bacterium]
MKVTVTPDHQLSFRLPDNFPAGTAELIILADYSIDHRIVKLAGVLTPDIPPSEDIDPILNALNDLRPIRESGLVSII